MDERHWWFAGKLQETFHFGGYDNPSVLEDFLSDFEVAELISKFLSPGEPRKLFFYCEEGIEEENGRASSAMNRRLRVTSRTSKGFLLQSLQNNQICLYVLRRHPMSEVDITVIDDEIYCGEIRQSVLTSLSNLLSNVYYPLLHQQKSWGSCPNDCIISFLSTFDKLTNAVQEMSVQSLTYEPLLQRPTLDLKKALLNYQPGSSSGTAGTGVRFNLTNEIVAQCDVILNDWICFIEGLLIEATNERLEDPLGLPLAERHKWERRQIQLQSVIEQLKWRESTAIIATLAAAKSKVIKKWRITDTQLTEAFNSCRDKVWYLTALQPHFDTLKSSTSPLMLTTDILPSLTSTIKQIEGLSRLFAHTGYITVLLKKISNLLSVKCQQLVISKISGDAPALWKLLFDEPHSIDTQLLITTLEQIIQLSISFKDVIYHLRDVLLLQQPNPGTTKRSTRKSSGSNKRPSSNTSQSTQASSEGSEIHRTVPIIQSGLTLNNISDITKSLNNLASRAENILELVKTVQKLSLLWPNLKGLPRVMEDIEDDSEESIAVFIHSALNNIRDLFKNDCPDTVSQIFAITSKDGVVFKYIYEKYTDLLVEVQTTVCRYLTTLIPEVKESKRALNIIEKFHCISCWSLIDTTLHQCLILSFKHYSVELQHLKQIYESQKSAPPLSRGRPPIAGAIEWARGLLKRIEGPMNIFKQDEMLMKTPESHFICTMYNRLATALIQYETVLFKQLKDNIDKTLIISMAAPLLRLQENEDKSIKIAVNIDSTGLLQLLEESKALKGLQLTVSPTVLSLLTQETRIKEFQHKLQYQIDQLTTSISTIDKKLLPLFDDVITTVVRYYLPGWTTLTWVTLNIDPFLHQLSAATSSLQSLVQTTNNILNIRIYPTLDSICHLSLIDFELITSKLWIPQDFSIAVQEHIAKQSDCITLKISKIRTALYEIITLIKQTHFKLKQTLDTHSNTMRKSKDFVNFSLLHNSKLSKMSGQVSQTNEIKEKSNLLSDAVQNVLIQFSNILEENVNQLIKESLCLLHKSVCQDTMTANECVASVRLSIEMKFMIPSFEIIPDIKDLHNIMDNIIVSLTDILHVYAAQSWSHPSRDEEINDSSEEIIDIAYEIKTEFKQYFEDLRPEISEYIKSLNSFSRLWKKDLKASYTEFHQLRPAIHQWKDEVMDLVHMGDQIKSLPSTVRFGCVVLLTDSLKSTLKALASNWKSQFASHLHFLAKTALNTLVEQQSTMMDVLNSPVNVGDLDLLREVLELLEHIDELHYTIDEQYLPVEQMYTQLNEFGLHLEREEYNNVNSLRHSWNELISKANEVRIELLVNQQSIHIQETLKQVKEFIVRTIQIRNAFDTEGPLVPGLTPSEAVSRVGYFLTLCEELQKKKELFDAVQKLLNIPLTPYYELQHTQEELSYLRALYSNYQNFINFDETFRNSLWSEIDLDWCIDEIERFWQAFLSLPQEQQDWEASHKLSQGITNYRQTLPILSELHNKEIRNRHWIQIMSVTSSNFPLEARLFKLDCLLEADLLRYTFEIKGIIDNAKKEQELELQFLAIEEEWSEQGFHFETHSVCQLLSPSPSLSLLESLDSTQTQLTVMLMSKHINPLRNETAQWAGKLATISEVLQLWLSVQELWLSLHPIFCNTSTSKCFPDELVTFSNITDVWITLMDQASSIKNCIQCCITSEEPLQPILQKLKTDLEKCKTSLSSYLISKRERFPRLYFIPDDALLTLLSNSASTDHIKPYLGSLFGGISNIITTDTSVITSVVSAEGEELELAQMVPMEGEVEEWLIVLLNVIQSSIHQLILRSMDSDMLSLEELILYQLTQISCVSIHHQWTKDSEQALSCCRYDRRALPGMKSKFNNYVVMKLSALLMRHSWKHSDEPITPLHHNRLESLIILSVWLRDMSDDLCQRKLKDATDFEWKRFPRLVLHVSGEGDQQLKLHCLDVEFPYCNEFLSCQKLPVFNPRSNNYFISLSQAMQSKIGSSLILPEGVKKTDIVKGISYLVGQFTSTLYCTSSTDRTSIAQFLTGISQSGTWGCLCDIHLVPKHILSLLGTMLTTFSTTLKSKDITNSKLQPNMAVFVTHTPDWSLPTFLMSCFRSFSIFPPNTHSILYTQCLGLGLKGAKVLTYRLKTLLTLINDQLPLYSSNVTIYVLCQILRVAAKRIHNYQPNTTGVTATGGLHHVQKYDKQLISKQCTHNAWLQRGGGHRAKLSRTASPHQTALVLNTATIREHTLIAETIAVLLGAQFTNEELSVFQAILEDVFKDCPDIGLRVSAPDINEQLSSFLQSTSCFKSQLSLLKDQTKRNGLTPTKSWLTKTEQLFLLSKTSHAIIITGREASGKSSAIKTVISALNSKEGDTEMKSVRLQKIYPCVFCDQSEVFGKVDENGTWRDGIFTALVRKSIKATQTTVWICFDGPLLEQKFEYLGELTSTKCMSLANGEHLQINTDTIKLVFETGQLSNASPAALTHCSIICFDSHTLNWRSLALSWLSTRKMNESNCLQKLFETSIDIVSHFVLQKLEYHDRENEVTLFQTCLTYLSALLDAYTDTTEVFSELHVERIFLFSLIWSFGGVLLTVKEKEKFSQFLKEMTNSLPDDDTEYLVFDYYVDESGEWDVWQSKFPEERCEGVDLMGRVFIETPTTIRIEMLLELNLAAKQHVILSGPHASGKTSILNHFLSSRALNFSKTETFKKITFNGYTQSTDLHNFMKIHLQHRQGYTYGPADNRRLHLILDDLHLPKYTNTSTVTSYEYLRQVADEQGLHNLTKTNQSIKMEDILLFASLTSTEGASLIDQRLKRHFVFIPIDELSDEDLKAIIPLSLKNFTSLSNSISQSLFNSLVEASRVFYIKVLSVFKKSDTPGRRHYLLSLNNLESALQGLGFWSEATDQKHFAVLWSQEIYRAFGTGVCREEDKQWLTSTITSIAKQYINNSSDDEINMETHFFTSISPHDKKNTNIDKTNTSINYMPSISLHLINKWQSMEEPIHHYMVRYYEENTSNPPLNLELKHDELSFICSIHRAIKHPRGNCILVGSLGQQIYKLSQLALYIAGYTLHTVKDTSSLVDELGVQEVMKSLFRFAGLEGKQVALILEECHLKNLQVLGLLNSFISSTELPTLFTVEETSSLINALLPSIKRDFPSEQIDPEQYFTARVCQNLRVILCVSPNSTILNKDAHHYQGMLQQSQILWMEEWNISTINKTISWYLSDHPLLPTENISAIVHCMSTIHYYMLVESATLLQAGIGSLSSVTASQVSLPLTESYYYLLEKMDSLLSGCCSNRRRSCSLDLPYVGPLSLRHFVEHFCCIFKEKSNKVKKETQDLKLALNTLQNIEDSVKEMQSLLDNLKKKLSETSRHSSDLMKQVTQKSCQLERVKAMLEQSGPVFSAMKMVSEQRQLISENEDDDRELLAVFYDRLSCKSSRIDALISRTTAQLKKAEKEEKETHKAMITSKEQAHYWKSKIDRNMIDQIKALNNPPALVGTIVELMLRILQDSSDSRSPSPAIPVRKTALGAKMEREYWTQLQIGIGDSQHFLDLLDKLKWEEGLSTKSINLIESKLATSRNSGSATSQPSTASSGASHTSTGSSGQGLITVSMAKHASESAAVMCGFAVAIVDYNYSFQPYYNAQRKVEKLKKDLEALKNEVPLDFQSTATPSDDMELDEKDLEIAGEDDLIKLEEDLVVLRNEFDTSVMEKHNLQKTCQILITKLKLAKNLLESLQPRVDEWKKRLTQLPSTEALLNSCIISAAFLTYCGPLQFQSLQRTLNYLSTQCYPHIFNVSSTNTNIDIELFAIFLMPLSSFHHLSLEGLPMDLRSVLTACIIGSPHTSQWPLIIDPLNMVFEWVKSHFTIDRTSPPIAISHNDDTVNSVLSQCMVNGKTLIVTDVDVHKLSNDVLLSVIGSKGQLLTNNKMALKYIIDGKEIECSNHFRLILITNDSLHDIPKHVSSKCSLVLFQPEIAGLEYRFLHEFLAIQNAKTSRELQQIKIDIYTLIVKSECLDKQLLIAISNDRQEIELEAKTINKLLMINKSLEFAYENLTQSKEVYNEITSLHISLYTALANRAAIITNTICLMGYIRPLYYTSFEYALNVFKTFIIQTGSRIQGEDSVSRITKFGYFHFDKGYLELDKLLFSIFLALSIEEKKGRAPLREREFLLNPLPGTKHAIKGLLNQVSSESASSLNFGKKPYDWMSEDQWQKLLTIASNFDWIHPLLSSFGRDGKEMLWRAISEGSAPETISLSDAIGQRLTLLQQMLIQCALRPERIAQFALVFASHVLELKPLGYFDLQTVGKGLYSFIPLLIYKGDPQLPLRRVEQLANKNQIPLRVINITDEISNEYVLQAVTEIQTKKQWVVLHQFSHANKYLIDLLCRKLFGSTNKYNELGEWKLWLSTDIDEITEVPSILKYCYRIAMDEPKLPISSLIHFLHICGQDDVVFISPRPEWLPLLHSVAMLHIVLHLRQQFCKWSFNYKWNNTHLMDALNFVISEFTSSEVHVPGRNTSSSSGRPVSWSGIRYMISQVIYGSVVNSYSDLLTLNAVSEHWLHPGGPRRESGMYHIPSIFFTPHTRLMTLVQSVENVSPPLVPNALLCGLHFTSEMKLSMTDTIFSQLELLHQINQENQFIIQATAKRTRRLTVFGSTCTPLSAGISSTATKKFSLNFQSAAAAITSSAAVVTTRVIDKLPSFIQLPFNILNYSLDGIYTDSINANVILNDAVLCKEIHAKLLAIVSKLLDSFSIGWKKDVLVDRLRKHNTGSPFAQFLAHEAQTLNKFLQDIANDLQHLQLYLKNSKNGDVFLGSPRLIETALSLVCLRVPQNWYEDMLGTSPPTDQWDLKEWLADIVMRFAFIDKVISWGMERMPTYWLGAFFNPQTLLAIFQQKYVISNLGNSEVVFVAELTSRDRDHIRDPPSEGLFVYGLYFWGMHFEKTANLELHDVPPKSSRPSAIPVVHLSLRPLSHVHSSIGTVADAKIPYIHYVPCVHTHSHPLSDLLFYLKISSNDVTSNKWIMRNISCSLRPF